MDPVFSRDVFAASGSEATTSAPGLTGGQLVADRFGLGRFADDQAASSGEVRPAIARVTTRPHTMVPKEAIQSAAIRSR